METLTAHQVRGYWPPATSGTANASGTANSLFAAPSGTAIMQVMFAKVRNVSDTETNVTLEDTAGNELFSDTLVADAGYVYSYPFELDPGVGLRLSLSGANAIEWSVLSRYRGQPAP